MTNSFDMMIKFSTPVVEPHPWTKAFGFSSGCHAALLLMLLILTKNQVPKTVLTEVHFIPRPKVEQPAPVAMPIKAAAPAVVGTKEGSRNGVAQALPVKSNVELHTQGHAPLIGSDLKGGLPSGKSTSGKMGASVPLSGPIVTSEPIGWVGQKHGALKELATRTGGSVGSGVGGKPHEGVLAEPIALGKMGVDDIRKKEQVIGTPLIGQKVVSSAISGSGFGATPAARLATAELGQKRKTTVESLKANPTDNDKWGKSDSLFSMEGPLKYRKILKMELPPYPRWAEEKAIEAAVSIRLYVDSAGRVKDNLYLESTSGYAELDQSAMDYLKRFVFVKMPDNVSQEDEWGVATFRFKLTK